MKDLVITLKDRFDSMYFNLNMPIRRMTPYIVTSSLEIKRAELLAEFIQKSDGIIIAPLFYRPVDLFFFLQTNHNKIIFFEDDILSRRIEYIRVLQGAVCSGPESMDLWLVKYEDKSFEFKGSIVITSTASEEKLRQKENLRFIIRDCVMI